MSKKDNRSESKNSSNKIFNGADKLLSHIQLEFGKDMKVSMINYFKSIDDLIFQIADQSKSKKKQQLYFNSLKSIRAHKLNVLSSFFNTIKNIFNSFENQKFNYFEDKITKITEEKNTISANFDKNDITEKLAQNNIIHKFEKQYQNQLLAFEKRFSFLIGIDLEPYHIPIGPYVIVSAFAKSVRLLHLDINLKLILYKHFEHKIMSNLNDLYKNINLYLNNNGIVTGIENNIVNQSVNISKKKINADKPKKTNPYDQEFLVSALDILQEKIDAETSQSTEMALTPVEIEQALLVQLMQSDKSKNKYLDQSDKDTFYLVTLLFQLIVENVNIPETIQVLITKMQIPYLKAALFDRDLIRKKQHPAQTLLNLISKSSLGWNSKFDINSSFINKLNKTIDSIAKSPSLNEDFFNLILKDYHVFMNHMKNSFAIEQKRINDKSKGKEKIIAAMTTVEALLNLKMDSNSLPNEIKIILLGPWKSLLILLLVRHSNSSEKYLIMVNFIDELLNILDSNQYEVVIRNNIEKLASEYEYGLKLVAYNGEELEKKVEDFKMCLLKHHKLDSQNNEVNKIPEKSTSGNIITRIHTKITDIFINVPDPILEQENFNLDIFKGLNLQDKALIESITMGTWIDFSHKNGNLIRTQLSWISPKTNRLIFVNNRGLKITDKSAQELVDDIHHDRAFLV